MTENLPAVGPQGHGRLHRFAGQGPQTRVEDQKHERRPLPDIGQYDGGKSQERLFEPGDDGARTQHLPEKVIDRPLRQEKQVKGETHHYPG